MIATGIVCFFAGMIAGAVVLALFGVYLANESEKEQKGKTDEYR